MSDIELYRPEVPRWAFAHRGIKAHYENEALLKSHETILIKALFVYATNDGSMTELGAAADCISNIWALHLGRADDCLTPYAYKSLVDAFWHIRSPRFAVQQVITCRLTPGRKSNLKLPPAPGERQRRRMNDAQATYRALLHWEVEERDLQVWEHPVYGRLMRTIQTQLKNQLLPEPEDDWEDE